MSTKKLTAVIATLMSVVIFLFTLSPAATAILSRNGSITLHVKDNITGVPLADASFRLYYFAKAYESGSGVEFELIPPYDECNIDLSDLQDASVAVHLAYFATSKSLPYIEKSTDKNGVLVFDDLEPGLYLIVPDEEMDGYYTPSPFIISIPRYDSKNKTWEYDIDASPKIQVEKDDETKTYITVKKKWETDKEHPESITVVLLRDLKVYDRVQLNEDNNWYYRWDKLPKDHVWNVVEVQVPDGYIVYYEISSNTVTIINRSDDETTTKTTNTTDITDTTDTTDSTQHITESSTGDRTTQSTDSTDKTLTTGTTKEELIRTGQLNWPVPVAAVAGLLVFSLGWAMLNFGKKENE